jgi:hypothetical protein
LVYGYRVSNNPAEVNIMFDNVISEFYIMESTFSDGSVYLSQFVDSPLTDNERQVLCTIVDHDFPNLDREARILISSECGIDMFFDNKCWQCCDGVIAHDNDLLLSKVNFWDKPGCFAWFSLY